MICLTMLRLLVTFLYQEQGLQELKIVQNASNDTCKHKLNETCKQGLRVLQRVIDLGEIDNLREVLRLSSIIESFNMTDEPSLSRLILKRIERLSPSWS